MVSIYLIIRNCQTLLQSGCTIFHSHQQCMGVAPAVLFPFQHLVISVLSDFSHCNDVRVSHCVLILVFLITNDVEYLLLWLWPIRLFPFVKCMFQSFVLFKLFLSVLCMFHTPVLCQIHVLWIFSLRLWLAVIGRRPRWTLVILASWYPRSWIVSSSLEQTRVRFSKRNCESNGTWLLVPGCESHLQLLPFPLGLLVLKNVFGKRTKTCW